MMDMKKERKMTELGYDDGARARPAEKSEMDGEIPEVR